VSELADVQHDVTDPVLGRVLRGVAGIVPVR